MSKVFVFGSLNMDLVIKSAYMPVAGQTITGKDFATNPGGKGANQAVACGKLGADVCMAGCVGDDLFGEKLLQSLKDNNVDTSHIRKVSNCNTGVAVVIVAENDNRIILEPGANAVADKCDVDGLLSTAEKDDILLVQLENDIDVVGYALKTAKEKGMFTILNPAPMNDGIVKYLKYVSMITPNESEFRQLTGKSNIEEGADVLAKQGIDNIVITLGSKGYCYISDNKTFCEDCIKVDVVDTTGAGDTFNGAIATGLSKNAEIQKVMRFANRAAALSVSKFGAQAAIPTISELRKKYTNDII